jgi:hypothetical protein
MGTIDRATAEKIRSGALSQVSIQYIIEYNNMFNGGLAYGCIGWRENKRRYHESPACINPRLWWSNPKAEPF